MGLHAFRTVRDTSAPANAGRPSASVAFRSWSRPPSGTVTFLFTDIEGSTRLWEEQPDAMRAALALHDALVRGAIEAQGGRVVKSTGDGAFAAFASPERGARSAVDAQVALADADWPAGAAASGPDGTARRGGDRAGRRFLRPGREPGGAGDVGRARRADRVHGGGRRSSYVPRARSLISVSIGCVICSRRCICSRSTRPDRRRCSRRCGRWTRTGRTFRMS